MKKRTKRELIKNFAILIITIILILSFAEILTRIFVEERPRTDDGLTRYNQLLSYELTPDFRGFILGKETYINSAGFRDKEYPIKKRENTIRIAVIGDSITFGYGVAQNETYPKLLEKKLNDLKCDKKEYEVMNFGVPGYNTVQEYEIISTKVINYSPDIIIIGFFFNDAEEKINYLRLLGEKNNYIKVIFNLERYLHKISHFYKYVKFKLQNTRFFMETFSNKITFRNFMGTFEDNSSTFNSFKNALYQIGNLTKERDIPVFFVMHPLLHYSTMNTGHSSKIFDIHEKVGNLAVDQGFITLELFDYVKNESLYDLRLKTIYNRHPDVLYYDIAASAIYENLKKEGLLPCSK